MPVRYEWKVAKNGSRKFVRSFPADNAPAAMVVEAPEEPIVAEVESEAVAVPTTPKPTVRRRKPAAKKSDG